MNSEQLLQLHYEVERDEFKLDVAVSLPYDKNEIHNE